MKTYVLMLAKYFPNNHHKAGLATCFKDKIDKGIKIHTIRANYPLWKNRISRVQKGEAIISIRQWEGKPYRSKQIEVKILRKEDGVGIEKITLPPTGELATVLKSFVKLDENDGLTLLDWMNWFEHYERNKPLAIIHFTPFRYNLNNDC